MLTVKSADALKSDVETMPPEAAKSDCASKLSEAVHGNVEPSSPDGPVLEHGTKSLEFSTGSVFAAPSDGSMFEVKANWPEHVRGDGDESSSEAAKCKLDTILADAANSNDKRKPSE
jgi:hypothetical protein